MSACARLIAFLSLLILACEKKQPDSMLSPPVPLVGDWDLLMSGKFGDIGDQEENKIKWVFLNENQLKITAGSDFDLSLLFPKDSLNVGTKDTTINYQLIDSTRITIFGETYEYLVWRNTMRLIRSTDLRADRFYFREE